MLQLVSSNPCPQPSPAPPSGPALLLRIAEDDDLNLQIIDEWIAGSRIPYAVRDMRVPNLGDPQSGDLQTYCEYQISLVDLMRAGLRLPDLWF